MGTYRLYSGSDGQSHIEAIDLAQTPDWTNAQVNRLDVHHKSAAENVGRLVPNAELRPSAWSHAEWDVIGQHDHTFPGIAATNRYSMKATFYATQLLELITKVESMQPSTVA